MELHTEPSGNPKAHKGACPADDNERAAVLEELERILSSQFFRNSNRSKQFLSYVVQHRLEGHSEPLKERTIGAELFHRAAGYATGEDPVVRVQAGEVRRRLEQYYHANPNGSPVRIDVPLGAYAAEFSWTEAAQPTEAVRQSAEAEHLSSKAPNVHRKQKPFARPKLVLGFAAVAASVVIAFFVHSAGLKKSDLDQFWSPVFSTTKPVLICLAKPMVYRPSGELYQKYSKTPGAFQTELERLSQPPPLQPNDRLVWGDMVSYPDYGVAMGDVYAAIRLSSLLGRIGKESELRIGNNYSFEDLRNSPAIVVGAFNNRWTMQITSNLHFAFVEENGQQMIREQGPSGRIWQTRFGPQGEVIEDFGIVTRLLNSKTGQFVVAAAGIRANGTQAAGELISSPKYFGESIRNAPRDWKRENMQIVVETSVTDSVVGPPHVVATFYW